MIVEYFGIPGSGKTYRANLFKEKLKREGIKYIDISRYRSMPIWLKVFYKLADYAIVILPKYRKQIAEYSEICKSCTDEPAFVPFSLRYCIKDIVLYSLVNEVFCHFGKTVVNDEGQLHRALSLVVQYGCSLAQVLDIYLSHRHDGIVRYVRTSAESAYKNIKKRNRKVCPMDEMNDKILMEYTKIFEKVCEEAADKYLNNIEIV